MNHGKIGDGDVMIQNALYSWHITEEEKHSGWTLRVTDLLLHILPPELKFSSPGVAIVEKCVRFTVWRKQ